MLRVAFLTASSSCLSTISRFTPAERQFVRHRLRKCFTSHFCVREIPACPRLFTTFRSRARLLLDAAVGDAHSSLGSGRDRFVVRHHHQRHALGVRGSE